MPTPTRSLVRRQHRRLLQHSLLRVLGRYLPRELLPARSKRSRATLFTPLVVLWACLVQTLDRQASDQAASCRVGQWLGVDLNTRSGGLCKGRQRLSEAVLQRLVKQVAEGCWYDRRRLARAFRERRVLVLDGSSVTVADTPQNRAAYGLPSCVKPGCGYPVLTLMVLMDARSGAVLAWSVGPCDAAELELAQPLLAQLQRGDVLVADSGFGSYGFLAQVRSLGADLIARQHGSRVNQRPGRSCDWVETWRRPATVARCHEAACRARSQAVRCVWTARADRATIKLVTTLPQTAASARTIRRCYRDRWRIETQLNQLKTVQHADFLPSRLPATVARSLALHLLALNLLCAWRCDVAREHGLGPWRLSLTALRDGLLSLLGDVGRVSQQLRWLWSCARAAVLPERPGRAEPRRVKRRPKTFARLNQPRDELRAKLKGGR